jgi:saccharopine dehydrogenase (NAD+, L-lysine forming)
MGNVSIKIGILRETKIPPVYRVAFSPEQILRIKNNYPDTEIIIQPGDTRCFTDEEYRSAGLTVGEDIRDCNLLIGLKEVDPALILENKTYVLFSHTAKKQSYNRGLLQKMAQMGNTLIDYEYLTDKNNVRVVAFGYWAGIVGAYNGLLAYGKRFDQYNLKPAHDCFDRKELEEELKKVKLPAVKILITGGGRVAGGAKEILKQVGVREVTPEAYLSEQFSEAVYAQIEPQHYTIRKDRKQFEFGHFIKHPYAYQSVFLPYTQVTDLFLACHFWDPASPVFITREDMMAPDFNIKVIADISCDLNGPIASTIRASTIDDPLYGYDPYSGRETLPFSEKAVTVMAVDNLPGELPRDSSADFGNALLHSVIPSLLGKDEEGIIQRATILKEGKLTEPFLYLEDFLSGKK